MRHCMPPSRIAVGRNCASVVVQQSVGMFTGLRANYFDIHLNPVLGQRQGNNASEDSWSENGGRLRALLLLACHGNIYVSLRESSSDNEWLIEYRHIYVSEPDFDVVNRYKRDTDIK